MKNELGKADKTTIDLLGSIIRFNLFFSNEYKASVAFEEMADMLKKGEPVTLRLEDVGNAT